MIRVGILFGGASREREVSFAGGRTVYDNLDKHLFQAIPLFTDSFGNLCELDWQNVYKGSIRDFYPPVTWLPESPNEFQVYAESLELNSDQQRSELLSKIGTPLNWEDLRGKVDFVFLALHGPAGEDGSIQGLLEWLGIPYSGSGILPSAIGISKITQKNLQQSAFNSPAFCTFSRHDWRVKSHAEILSQAIEKVGFPMVVKSANQGSSIGVSILKENNAQRFSEALDKSFFSKRIKSSEWKALDTSARVELIRQTADIREGIGMPLLLNGKPVLHPEQLLKELDASSENEFLLEAVDTETEILIESFIEGREFSCIVVEDENGQPFALPPTEIVKNIDLYDYRSKYLPGLSRKVTPIDIAPEMVDAIRKECVRLYRFFGFHVYARIDGFINKDGKIFLNDPNTTSGMMPSSFFFHQAAEVGLNPSQFLTFIIRNSLAARARSVAKLMLGSESLLKQLDASLLEMAGSASGKEKIAVVMGGYSSERHISVESGRNIYEKLSSSEHYQPMPVFLTGNDESHTLHLLPVNIMLKDNADDILEKVKHYRSNPVLEDIRRGFSAVTAKYNPAGMLAAPREITYSELAELVDGVFIALHGRPGEDGVIQSELEKYNLPYNGSGVASSKITINKYETNEILRKNGFNVAGHILVHKQEWQQNPEAVLNKISETIGYPLIAKPADDGCSSAVKKIKNASDLSHFAELMFRNDLSLDSPHAHALNLKANEEFPCKTYFLVEQFIEKGDAEHFLEITGGLLTHRKPDGKIEYEMFEPSETLAESDILSLEEKFLAGQGQNITPARFSSEPLKNRVISEKVRAELKRVAEVLNIEGYCRIDAFVKIYPGPEVKVYIIEVNSLPGMTPATCIFHQCAINGYKPFEFIDAILHYGFEKFNTHDKAAAH